VFNIEYERPFKNREEVKDIINKCNLAAGFLIILGLIFALLGIISDAFDINLILESSNWLLLAILFVIASFMPFLNSAIAKHLYGIESENKNK
jgi:membrane-bound acyltransferase YfiQ involved in biofilm formation